MTRPNSCTSPDDEKTIRTDPSYIPLLRDTYFEAFLSTRPFFRNESIP